MNESESKNEKPKEGRRFSQEQYEFLKECSEKGTEGINKWNQWRDEPPGEDILLEGADLSLRYLEGARLELTGVEGNEEDVYLREANLSWANLEGAALMNARLNGAKLWFARLQGADVSFADLRGAELMQAKVDGGTTLWKCQVDRKTNAEGVALDRAVIDPGTKQLLEYNIRRMNWEEWYKEQHWSLRWLVRKFWQISDYGISTKQIIKTFFKLAFVFAIIYYIWGFIDYYLVGIKDYPGIVSDLFVLEDYQEEVSCWLVPFRAVYFSVVTMTTLGFGDMYANAHSFLRGLFGHVLLALQVILGYVLLGALVTRFAVLFTAGGPAGRFADEKKNRNKTTEKIKN